MGLLLFFSILFLIAGFFFIGLGLWSILSIETEMVIFLVLVGVFLIVIALILEKRGKKLINSIYEESKKMILENNDLVDGKCIRCGEEKRIDSKGRCKQCALEELEIWLQEQSL